MNQNPDAWTPPGIESAAQPGRQASQEHLMALFVGEKYQRYYQAKFAEITPKKLLSGFNIGAFFFGVIWLFYRKMYLYGFAALGLIIAVSLIEIALDVEGHGSGIGLAVFFGLMSNSLYKHFAERKIAAIQRQAPAYPDDHIRAAGGTNIGAALGLIAAAAVFILLSSL